MAKRGAEEQITKDDEDRRRNDSDEEDEIDPGMRTQPLAPVAGREVRPLPKRKGMGGASVPSFGAPKTENKSAFAGFSFGAPSAPASASQPGNTQSPIFKQEASSSPNPFGKPASSPFTFGTTAPAPAQSSAPSAPATAPSFPTFGAPSSSASTTTSAPAPPKAHPFAGFTFGQATKAPEPVKAPEATKVSEPAKEPEQPKAPEPLKAPEPKQTNGFAKPTPTENNAPAESEVSYYTSIRGLNTAIIALLSSTIEKDPFTDLSAVLPGLTTQYEKHLEDLSKKAGWRPEGSKQSASEVAPAGLPTRVRESMPNFASTASDDFSSKHPAATMPTLPTVPFTLLNPGPPAKNGGFQGFSFEPPAATPAKSAETPKKPSAEVTKMVEEALAENPAPSNPFSFSAPTTSSTPSSTEPKKTALFSFAPSGPIHPTTPDSKTFTPSKSIEEASPAKLGKFGPGGSQPQLSFGGAKSGGSQSGTPDKPKPFSFGFGTAAPAPPTGAAFSFGTASATPSSSGFSFGSSTSGSTDKPSSSSFSFGSSAPASTSAPSAPSFAFKPFTPPTSTDTPESSEPAAEGESAAEPSEPSVNLASTAGAGEENEDIVLEQRGKLHKFVEGAWKVEGLGQFKLKKAKEGGKRRLLMRSDGVGNVVLNMSVPENFNPTADKATVTFLGADSKGEATSYLLRVKTPDIAKDLVEKIKKELS